LRLSSERQAEIKNEFKSVLSAEAGALLDDINITEQFQREFEQILEISGLMQQSLASGSANGLFAEIQQEITVTDVSAGEVQITCDKTIPSGKEWSGVLNIITFKALSGGSTSLEVFIE